MPRNPWTQPTETLDAFRDAIRRKTEGRLSELVVTSLEGRISICAKSKSYYGIQLALVVIKGFSKKFPHLAPSTLSFSIDGRRLVLDGLRNQSAEESIPRSRTVAS